MTPLRIALYQGPGGVPATREDSLRSLENAASRAALAGARLLVTPELSLTGYALGEAVDSLAEPADGPAAQEVAKIAKRHDLAVLYGYPERAHTPGAGGASQTTVYNAAQVIGPDGVRLANYRKTHLYGPFEQGAFQPGHQAVVQAELDGLRLGLLICYDVEFPEAVRAHALAGTELLLVPTALMRPYEFVATTLIPTRAWESQLYLAYTNRHGPEGEFTFAGLSALAAPDGTVRARAGVGEDLVVTDVDPALLAASRAENTYLTDRRPELYDPASPQGEAS